MERYGRLLSYMYVGDTKVNELLLIAGHALVSTYPPDVKYTDPLLAAQRSARDSNSGLWKDYALTPAPGASCDPAYPTVCVPPISADLVCPEIGFRRFVALAPDPHRFDGDRDRLACEV